MSDAKHLTATVRMQCIEFCGASLGELKEAAQRFATYSGLNIFGATSLEREGVTCLVVTYTNPEIPWLSPEEPLTITFRGDVKESE